MNMSTVIEIFARARQHHQRGELAQAEHFYQQTLQADPNHADAHHMLGVLALQTGRFHVAIASIRKALELNPQAVSYHANLGLAHQALGQINEALPHLQEAVRLQPDSPLGHRNLGKALLEQGNANDAIAHCREALRLRPGFAEAHNTMATALLRQGNAIEAAFHCREALRLKSDYIEALNNLGTAYKQQGQFTEASAAFEQALLLKTDYAAAHWNRSMLRLLQGDFEQGWPEYEWRWALHSFAARPFTQPLWNGSSLAGKTILLHGEQGLGDMLQFVRYAPLVKQRGGKVIVECHAPLTRLLSGFRGIDGLLSRGSGLPRFDVHAPILSLPGMFRTTLATIPASVPYIHADGGLVRHWRRTKNWEVRSTTLDLRSSHFTVGVAWQGNPQHPQDHLRSIPLAQFAPLMSVQGVQFVSLQKGPGTKLARDNFATCFIHPPTSFDEAGPFMDTAAIMQNLDLVISSDTVVPHLAGVLGVPVWVALPLAPDWRWLLQREDSPWYPTMRLFRQTKYGQWEDVFARMAEELRGLLEKLRQGNLRQLCG
jgi:Flp pilus assembly protein TadD